MMRRLRLTDDFVSNHCDSKGNPLGDTVPKNITQGMKELNE